MTILAIWAALCVSFVAGAWWASRPRDDRDDALELREQLAHCEYVRDANRFLAGVWMRKAIAIDADNQRLRADLTGLIEGMVDET